MITPIKVTAIKLAERSRKDISARARKTTSIRSQIFDSKEICDEYFSEHGVDGVKQILISVNSVADSNQLAFLNDLSPTDAFALLVAYNTLRGADPTPENETMTYGEVMTESLRWAERLNKHPDATYSQDPRFALQPTPAGNVIVGDEIVETPSEEAE